MTDVKLSVCRLGVRAVLFMRRYREAKIAAIFDRSMYLSAGEDFVCLGGPDIGNGPLNIIVEPVPGADWLALVGRDDVCRSVDPTRLGIGTLDFQLSGAATWQPPAWPWRAHTEDVASGLARLVEIVRAEGPDEGLVRLCLGTAEGRVLDPGLERVATAGLSDLRAWLAQRIAWIGATNGDGAGRLPPPTGLLGLGPGLTPSGDDLLCGALLALHAINRREIALELASAIGLSARELTSPLSGAFLRAAADGQGSAILHELIGVVISGDRRELPGLVRHIGRIGHTSGWDALAGVYLVFRVVISLERHRSTRSP